MCADFGPWTETEPSPTAGGTSPSRRTIATGRTTILGWISCTNSTLLVTCTTLGLWGASRGSLGIDRQLLLHTHDELGPETEHSDWSLGWAKLA